MMKIQEPKCCLDDALAVEHKVCGSKYVGGSMQQDDWWCGKHKIDIRTVKVAPRNRAEPCKCIQ